MKFLFCDKSLWSMRKVCAHLFYSSQVGSIEREFRDRKNISKGASITGALEKFLFGRLRPPTFARTVPPLIYRCS
jgi:hypothetical protein